ncbi:MAG: helix-turn-helix domain-containing protein, partial [Nanoarchaeota archaeon]
LHSGQKIKKKREQMGMRQKDLARFLNERESFIHQLESGHIKPSQKILHKLKEKLGLDLLREKRLENQEETETSSSSGTYTIGDILKK